MQLLLLVTLCLVVLVHGEPAQGLSSLYNFMGLGAKNQEVFSEELKVISGLPRTGTESTVVALETLVRWILCSFQ